MPTARPRHPITETDEVSSILREAQRRWGDLAPTKLIQLILADWANGGRSPAKQFETRAALAGSVPGSAAQYERDEDWPK